MIRPAFRSAGWRTIALVRSPPRADDADALPFRLGAELSPGALSGVDVLVHCAYDLGLRSRQEIWRVNVTGTERLLAAAELAGVWRVIVISSAAAYAGTSQIYGQAKLAIEEIARARGAVIMRPGLVYGTKPGGMVGGLKRVVSLPIVPLLAGQSHLYTLHQDDLAEATLVLATAETAPREPVDLESADPVSVAEVLRALAGAHGSNPLWVPFSWRPVYWIMCLAERLGVFLPFRADSLWGLAHPPPPPDRTTLDALGLRVRPFTADELRP